MPLDLFLAFMAASLALIAIPGPNVALIVATSLSRGVGAGLVTVAGTSAAMVLQLAATVIGMAALLELMADWFEVLRWLGVAYLALLGIRAFLAGPGAPPTEPAAGDARRLFLRGFLVSLTNPKTLLFYGAFLPQFVSPAGEPAPQLALLSVTFVVLAGLGDSGWALLAGRLRPWLAASWRWRNRLTGALLLGAGLGLALARRS